jgi:hypothetical protein
VIVAVRPDEIVLSSTEIGEISAESEIDSRGTSFEPRSPPSSDPNGGIAKRHVALRSRTDNLVQVRLPERAKKEPIAHRGGRTPSLQM